MEREREVGRMGRKGVGSRRDENNKEKRGSIEETQERWREVVKNGRERRREVEKGESERQTVRVMKKRGENGRKERKNREPRKGEKELGGGGKRRVEKMVLKEKRDA